MKKFFIVGKYCLLLGKEIKKDSFKFTIGRTLFDQIGFVEINKVKDKFLVHKINNVNSPIESLFLLCRALEKNFGKNKFFIQKEIIDSLLFDNTEGKTTSKKYDKLTDVYEDPSVVPWNFMPTEIEDVLSFFKKNILKDKKILYIGAGYGKNIWAIKNKKYDIDTIEFSGTAAKRANKIFGRNIIIQHDLIDYNAGENKYDIVLDIGCLHSIPGDKRKKAIDNIYKLLATDGILISRTFKPRKRAWLERMPFKINDFGLDKKEMEELFKNFSVKIKYQNKDYVILEAKKC